ncbi:hypothetical protein COT48_01965, partial [Candidatus Woesearchaeota archaeon CG08_land_8_20_14_0_20_47_9]
MSLSTGGYIDDPFITAEALDAATIKSMYEHGKRALASHAGSDDRQKLQGSSSQVNSVTVDETGEFAYVGTDSGMNKLDLKSDTVVDYWAYASQDAVSVASGTLAFANDSMLSVIDYGRQKGLLVSGFTNFSSGGSGMGTALLYNASRINLSYGSLSLWFKPFWSNDSTTHYLLSADTTSGNFSIAKQGNWLNFSDGNNSATITILNITPHNWHHIAASWDSS